MRNQHLVREWLKRARSSLERAKAGKVSEAVIYEDLCFDCQQAVEKSLKALLISLDVVFPWTHSIARLIELIEETGTVVPSEIKDAIILSEYAVTTRYPGDYEPVADDAYRERSKLPRRCLIGSQETSKDEEPINMDMS